MFPCFEAGPEMETVLEQLKTAGQVTITQDGQPVAILSAFRSSSEASLDEVFERIREFRKGKSLGGVSIRELREEGQR